MISAAALRYDYSGCGTAVCFSLSNMEVPSQSHPKQTRLVFCSLWGCGEVWGINTRVCVCLCVVKGLMVGSGNAPSLTPLHDIGWDFLVPELSWGGLIDVCVWAPGNWYGSAFGQSSSSDWYCHGLSKKNSALHLRERTNWQCLLLIKNKEGGSLSQMFSCCVSSRMFTASISDLSLYLWNILWVDKTTGQTLIYQRSLRIVGTQAESAVSFLKLLKTWRLQADKIYRQKLQP